jgi:hypothetical protein
MSRGQSNGFPMTLLMREVPLALSGKRFQSAMVLSRKEDFPTSILIFLDLIFQRWSSLSTQAYLIQYFKSIPTWTANGNKWNFAKGFEGRLYLQALVPGFFISILYGEYHLIPSGTWKVLAYRPSYLPYIWALSPLAIASGFVGSAWA